MGESWSARSRRIARERKAEARGYGTTGGTWGKQSRAAARVHKAKVREVQGKGSWSARARRAQRAQRSGARAWWRRAKKGTT